MVDVDKLLELNFSGLTQKQIAKELGISRTTVQKKLRKLHVNTPNYHNSLKFDNTVFDSIDTEEKAYWLGFLFADGNVSSTINNVELSLAEHDKEHLEKYRKFLKSKSEVKTGTITVDNKVYKRCRLAVTNVHFKQRLIELGCVPNKTQTLEFPDDVFENDSLVYPFIRGYVDGDGCISFTPSGRNTLEIIGTKEFLSKIKLLFPEFKAYIKDKRWKGNTYVLRCSCDSADKVLKDLYFNSNIYLQRKYNRIAVLQSNL